MKPRERKPPPPSLLPACRELSAEVAAELGISPGVIPSLAGYSVALDTSALSNVLNGGKALIRRFAEAVKRHCATIAISETALFELVADASVEAVARRLKALQLLQRELGPLLWLSLESNDLIGTEARGWLRGPVGYTDIDWAWLANAHRRDLLEVAADGPESHAFMSQKKKDLYDLDRSLHQDLRSRGHQYDPAQLLALITGSDPPRIDEMIIEKAAKFSEGRYTPEQVAADRIRFKATHAISHLVWRLQLANCADPKATTPEQAQVLGRWRTKAGTRGEGVWYDSYIAGEAAYMDELVSDDENQRWRCDFLRERHRLTFKTRSLSQFIG